MYALMHSGKEEEAARLADIIVRAVSPQKIFLLGITERQRRTESIFCAEQPSLRTTGHYFLLVLVTHSELQTCSEVQDKIENSCRHLVPTTAIVLEEAQFSDWLKQGHPFALKVQKGAAVLYRCGDEEKVVTAALDQEHWHREQRQVYVKGMNRVDAFLATAELLRLREQYRTCAFLLHQAAEQALATLVRTTTGLRVNTHNLDKLLRLGTMVCYRLGEVFSKEEPRSARLLELLQRAYIDARYKEDYSISVSDIEELTGRVRRLEALLEAPEYNYSRERCS